jgi:DNA-directed RNA polymerase subunit delta
MNINKMTTEELELMSHTDIAYNILKNEKKTFTTIELLKKICKLLNYGDIEYENLIGEFYTSLNVDKRFILIDGKWDLAENHAVKIVVDDEGDDEDIDNYDDEENEEPSETEDEAVLDDTEMLEDLDDSIDEDMDDLTILTEEEMEDEEL